MVRVLSGESDYTCTAWNGVGEKANATAAVTVHCKLFFPYNA